MSKLSTDEILLVMNTNKNDAAIIRNGKIILKRRGYYPFYDNYMDEYVLH